MKINVEFKPWLLAADVKDGRPILAHISVTTWQGKDVAIAANGFAAAVIPVEMEEDDIPGLVDAAIFKAAHGLDKKSWSASLRLRAEYVTLSDGSLRPRTLPENDKKGAARMALDAVFPPLGKILEPKGAAETMPSVLTWNHRLMRSVMEALGIAAAYSLVGRTGLSESSPWIIGHKAEALGRIPPFGVAMPVHSQFAPEAVRRLVDAFTPPTEALAA